MQPWRKRIWLILIAVSLPVLLGLLLLAYPRARAALRLVLGFHPLPADQRVFLETGAEDFARSIADALPAAIAQVEKWHGTPFSSGFRIYICASHQSFARRIGYPETIPVRGTAFPQTVWISPLAFNFHGRDTHRQTLTHELSHLHVSQNLSWVHRTRRLPTWFVEGLPNLVAGTGEVLVSRTEAVKELCSGNHFVPASSGRLRFRPPPPGELAVSWPLLHMQSRLFMEYLHASGDGPFRQFIAAVLNDADFPAAFRENFNSHLEIVWQDFLQSLCLPSE